MNNLVASENIKDRLERLESSSSEINIVKNQEDADNTLTMSEHNEDDQKPTQINKVQNFLHKYKFWIILVCVLFLSIIIGLVIYKYSKGHNKTSTSITKKKIISNKSTSKEVEE